MTLKPFEILQQLENNPDILAEATEDFWHGCLHGCDTLSEYPLKFVVADPMRFGTGVPDNVFSKIIDGMISGDLSERDFAIALGKFSLYCDPTEWELWFKPILQKTLVLPIPNHVYNQYCPDRYRFTIVTVPKMIPLQTSKKIPSDFIFEPYVDLPRYFWFVTSDDVMIYDIHGDPFDHPARDALYDIKDGMNEGVVFDSYLDNDIWIFRDALTLTQYTGNEDSLPLEYRLELLLQFYRLVLEPKGDDFTIIDFYSGSLVKDHNDDTRRNFSLIIEQGYDGVLIRDRKGLYFDSPDVIVVPEKSSILTCTEITMKDGVVEYLHGRGRIGKTSFETPVFHGLTVDMRGNIGQNTDEHIGKRFKVLSCGLGADQKLLFPIFKEWRTK